MKREFFASFWRFWWVICCVFLTLSPAGAVEAQKGEAAVLSVDFYPSGALFVFQASAASGNNF